MPPSLAAALRRFPGLPLALLMLAVAVLSACAGRAPADDPVRGLAVNSRVIGAEALYVEVVAAHRDRRHRLSRILLVDPGGRAVEAEETHTETIRDRGAGPRPFGSLVVGGGSGGYVGTGVGVGIGVPVGGGGTTFVRRATFRVPDPAGYRADPAGWRIRLDFRHDRDGPLSIDRPAPLPR